MTENGVVDEIESILRSVSAELTTPGPNECLACFVARMLKSFGCDTTLRWAKRYRDQRAPRATALERRLGDMGGFCDCEIFLNGITMVDELRVWDSAHEYRVSPAELPACVGVGRASTQWCRNWDRRTADTDWDITGSRFPPEPQLPS